MAERVGSMRVDGPSGARVQTLPADAQSFEVRGHDAPRYVVDDVQP